MKPLGESAVGLFWAPGYTASTNPIRVYDPRGTEVATEGDAVTLSGGIVFEPSAYCRTESYFNVSQMTKGGIEDLPAPP